MKVYFVYDKSIFDMINLWVFNVKIKRRLVILEEIVKLVL